MISSVKGCGLPSLGRDGQEAAVSGSQGEAPETQTPGGISPTGPWKLGFMRGQFQGRKSPPTDKDTLLRPAVNSYWFTRD